MSISKNTYESRMHRVLLHVDSNIAQPLSVIGLATVANFSEFHFHRLFAAWTGERVGDYVRRRRLEIAATRLVTQPETSILSVALSVGFGSAEAFTRAFRSRFAESPNSWRKRQVLLRTKVRNSDQPESSLDQVSTRLHHENGRSLNHVVEQLMQVRIETLKPTSIAYLRHTGPYGEPIGAFWVQTVAPWMEANGLVGNDRYGISHDDPSIVTPSKCRYDACVEVPGDLALSGNAQGGALPGGRYAVLDFTGDPSTINEAWTSLLRDWLPTSGLQMDSRPCFEYYPANADEAHGLNKFSCKLCIPVTKL